MINKIIVPLASFVCLFFLFQANVQAGGCCFKEVSLDEEGTAGVYPAFITGRLYSMAYIMAKEEPKYKANQIIQAINTQSPNVKCREAITDASGHFAMECASSQAGSFPIEVKPLAANDEAGSATAVTVIFKQNPNGTPTPTATATPQPTNTPTPTSTPVPTVEPTATPTATPSPTMDPVAQQRITELEAKVAEQEQEISVLQSIIRKFEGVLSRIFRFSRN